MSLYCTVETQFIDKECLINALCEIGQWNKSQIEIHNEPSHLQGYKGDTRQEVANIIIRRQYVGRDSNDIGFIKNKNNTYSAIISEYDKHKYNTKWINKVKQSYAFHIIKKQQENKGRTIERIKLKNGNIGIKVRGYR